MSIPSCSVQVRRIPMWRPTAQTRAAVGFVCVFNCLSVFTPQQHWLARWRNLPVFWSAKTVLISFNLGWRRPCCRWMLHDRLHWTPMYSFEYIVQRCTRDISRHHEMPRNFVWFLLLYSLCFVLFYPYPGQNCVFWLLPLLTCSGTGFIWLLITVGCVVYSFQIDPRSPALAKQSNA